MRRALTYATLIVFTAVITLGLPLLLSGTEHHHGCPLMQAQQVICQSSVIEHVSIWHALIGAILSLLSAVFLTFAYAAFVPLRSPSRQRLRHVAPRPTLMQELYAAGILNRREWFWFAH